MISGLCFLCSGAWLRKPLLPSCWVLLWELLLDPSLEATSMASCRKPSLAMSCFKPADRMTLLNFLVDLWWPLAQSSIFNQGPAACFYLERLCALGGEGWTFPAFDFPGRIPPSAILRFACYRATSVVRLSTLCLGSIVPATCQSVWGYQHPQNSLFFLQDFSLLSNLSPIYPDRILRNRQRAELVFQPAVIQICNLTAKGRWLMASCLHLRSDQADVTDPGIGPDPVQHLDVSSSRGLKDNGCDDFPCWKNTDWGQAFKMYKSRRQQLFANVHLVRHF